jgi:hypothetical protein
MSFQSPNTERPGGGASRPGGWRLIGKIEEVVSQKTMRLI